MKEFYKKILEQNGNVLVTIYKLSINKLKNLVATRAEFSLLKYRGNFALLFCVKIEPINSKELEEESKITINPEYGYEFSHTLESQI